MERNMEAVLFDLYQTLVYEKDKRYYAALTEVLGVEHALFMKAYNYYGTASMTGELPSMAHRVHASCQAIRSGHNFEDAWHAVVSTLHHYYESIALYADAEHVARTALANGYRLAIVSNASRYSWEVVRRYPFFSEFEDIVFSCDLGVMKPHPRMYLEACSRMRLNPEDCYFVGDGGHEEMKGARELGMKTVLVKRPEVRNYTAEDCTHAVYTVSSLETAYAAIERDRSL
jgi:putative hydrolase of the HAD superfamily